MGKSQKIAAILVGLVMVVTLAYFLGVEAGNYLNKRKRAEIRAKGVEKTSAILEKMGTIEVGDKLADFALDDINGNSHRLSELVTRRTVIMYVEPDCDGCLLEMEDISRATRDNDGHRHFIIISSVHPLHLQELRDNLGIKCLILFDEERLFGHSLSIISFPFNIIVDESMQIVEVLADQLLPEKIEEIIEINREE